jgi:archaellum component FlaC
MMNVYTKEDTADILYKINKNLETINIRLTTIENKIEIIEKKIDNEIVDECKKMGDHINFVENVYENVKHPLGYINNKIKKFMGNEKTYSLTENSDNN